jgi:hypothetical protein
VPRTFLGVLALALPALPLRPALGAAALPKLFLQLGVRVAQAASVSSSLRLFMRAVPASAARRGCRRVPPLPPRHKLLLRHCKGDKSRKLAHQSRVDLVSLIVDFPHTRGGSGSEGGAARAIIAGTLSNYLLPVLASVAACDLYTNF